MLGIVAAFKEEVNSYLKPRGFRVVAINDSLSFYQSAASPGPTIVVGAFGRQGAEEATRQLIESYSPDYIVSAGFAGGVKPGIRLGQIFLCDKLRAVEGPAIHWRPDNVKELDQTDFERVDELFEARSSSPDYGRCACLSVSEFIPSSQMKSWIGETFGVSIIDMESYWVSETAAAHGIPHLVVRCVLDTVEETLPVFVGNAVRAEQARSWSRALKYVARRPTELLRLIAMPVRVRRAGARLGEFLSVLDETLAAASGLPSR